MLKTRLTILTSSLVLATAAITGCGSDKPAKAPESTAGITESSTKESAKEDMPAPPSKEAETPKPAVEDKSAGAAGGMIPIAPLKITSLRKGKKDKSVELKADGTVNVDGKAIAKIVGDQVNDIGGPTLLTVSVDGSLVGAGVKPGLKLAGDELTNDTGNKLTIADDGTVNATKDGKSEPIAKVEGGASAKRAALVLLGLYMAPTSAPSEKATEAKATPTGTGNTADHGKKPADKKPAGKK